MPPTPELAKLSPPRLFRVSPRERLFRLLDELREHPVVWIAADPGTGKSVLIASYLEARKLVGVWFHVDPGDADPATSFYYLGLAGVSLGGKKQRELPLFTDEYRRDLGGFARRWFREFFARMPVGSVLAIDNIHQAAGAPEWRAAFATGLEEIPVGVNVIVASRAEPPPEFARLIAKQIIARIGPEEMRFTLEEARTLLGDIEAAVVDRLYERSDGWAAGLVLMREHATRGAATTDGGKLSTPEAVFAYFAGEIFNSLPPGDQRTLMLCALPPRAPVPIVADLTGVPEVGKLLEEAYRRHLFIARRGSVEPVYEFHPLFREFLLARARSELSREELAANRRRAAEVAEAHGSHEGVFELYRDAGDWDSAVRVTLADAPALLLQGRFRTLLDRIGALPFSVREPEPWLSYWEGVARLHIDPLAARAGLERAYNSFVGRGDAVAQIQAAEAVLIAHYLAWDDWRPVDRWIELLERLLAQNPLFPSVEAEARALSALAIGVVYRQPGHPLLAQWLARLGTLVDALDDKNLKVAIATRLIDGLNKTGGFAESQRIAERVRGMIDDPEVRPLTSVWCRVWLSNLLYMHARMAEFDAILAEALAIADTHGLGFFVSVITLFRAWGHLANGEPAAARRLLVQHAAKVDPARRLDLALCHYLECYDAALSGDFARAEREGRSAAQLSLETGSIASTLICHTGLALALDHNGQQAAAANVLERMLSLVADVPGGMLRYHTALWEAYLRLRSGDSGYRAPLVEALALGRREGYLNAYTWWPRMMSRLAAVAIAEGIEPDYVRRLVAARGLVPDETIAPDDWPWPLRIQALGGFSVARDAKPLAFRGKAQKKPMELLKALVALGGEGVEASRLSAILWPDASGDAAKVSFDSTLYRLRKLLANDAALVLHEGKLSLDRRQCWLDVWAFERVARAADETQAEARPADETAAAARSLVAAYPGHFLAGDEDQPWLIGMRDRLRSKLLRGVLALAKRLQEADRWENAVALYHRALELDNLAEDLYRNLMICYRELGRPSEALQVYRRCRELLSLVLGVRPSADTEAVRRSLATLHPVADPD